MICTWCFLEKPVSGKLIFDLRGNPVGSLSSLAFFRAKALQKCFLMEVVQKLKFPNNPVNN
jgi:hypothetical protein